jgi:hypothetical protein
MRVKSKGVFIAGVRGSATSAIQVTSPSPWIPPTLNRPLINGLDQGGCLGACIEAVHQS